ncbi:MAG: F0F1 ATP synthase subunit delta [Chloroflexota bacterium]
MAKAPIARRYAQALFSLASEHGKQEAWAEALARLEQAASEPTVALYFAEPRIGAQAKAQAVAQMAAGEDALLANFLGLLAERRAMGALGAIRREYRGLLDESLGRVQATVTTAVALSDAQRARLAQGLSQALGKQVSVDASEEPAIIGGLVVRVGDQVIDGSVRTRLAALRASIAHGSLS